RATAKDKKQKGNVEKIRVSRMLLLINSGGSLRTIHRKTTIVRVAAMAAATQSTIQYFLCETPFRVIVASDDVALRWRKPSPDRIKPMAKRIPRITHEAVVPVNGIAEGKNPELAVGRAKAKERNCDP